MKFVVFGLSISSSWGNGHATLWRGLCRALHDLGHQVVFFERDVPYYAQHRDLTGAPGLTLRLYPAWDQVRFAAGRELADADVAMVTSFCPDGVQATDAVLGSRVPLRVFYDLDSPVTLDLIARGAPVSYLGPRGLRDFDLVLSYTGGRTLEALEQQLGARRVWPLYGSVDPDVHHPATPQDRFRCDLSYLATYAADRQHAVESLLIEPARRAPGRRFVLGGSMYPADFPWTPNLAHIAHVAPPEHAVFYGSSRFTLSTTRAAMAQMGHCPSGRLFEAAACGVPVISDAWEGLDRFFAPGDEILIARDAPDVLDALALTDQERNRVASRARQRVLDEHTARHRAEALMRQLTGSPADQEPERRAIANAPGLPVQPSADTQEV